MVDLHGKRPGPWCPAYHKDKNRTECADKGCKFLQNRRVTITQRGGPGNEGEIDFDENLDAHSIEKPVIYPGRVDYTFHEECALHCVRFDEPSHLESLPWEV